MRVSNARLVIREALGRMTGTETPALVVVHVQKALDAHQKAVTSQDSARDAWFRVAELEARAAVELELA